MFFKHNTFRIFLRSDDYLRKVIFRNRKLSRRPVRVLTDDGQDYDAAFQPKIDPIVEPRLNIGKRWKISSGDMNAERPETQSLFKEKVLQPRIEGVPQYEKLGENNHDFVNTMNQLKSRKMRNRLDLLALEGKRLISDGIDAGLRLKTIYFSVEENLIGIKNLMQLPSCGVKIKKVFYRDLKLFSEHVTSPGVIGIFERPKTAFINNIHSQRISQLPVTLIADNVRDPGNLGTIVRTAAAVGVDKMLCVKGCVDAWEPKTVRSGCGAHFRVPIIQNLEWPLIENYLPKKSATVYVADSHLSEDRNEDLCVNRDAELVDPGYENEKTVVDEETGELLKYDESFENESILQKYETVALGTKNYCDVDYFKHSDSVVLIIGSEASGPSVESIKLCYDSGGSKVKIPLECGVESLNNSVAAAIILYEIKRQFNKNQK